MTRELVIGSAIVVVALCLGDARASTPDRTSNPLLVFSNVLSIVQRLYVDDVPPKVLIDNAIAGIMRALDPYSSYLDPDSYTEWEAESSGSFGGVGLEVTLRDDVLTVISAIEGTPASRAGLRPGDRIVAIDDVRTRDMQISDAVNHMRGKPGTMVTLHVLREGWTEPHEYPLQRERISVHSVRWQKLEDGVGYLRLREFQTKSPADTEAALKKLSQAGMTMLVLDLRNDPGGLLSAAVEIAEMFLEDGKLIVSTEGRVSDQNMRAFAQAPSPHLDLPMVVLVNEGSASASEIVAGALQDWGRAPIVGTQTFGKGSVQTIIPLSSGAALRLTTAKYFTPKGRSIHGKGITPDVIVAAPEPAADDSDSPPTDVGAPELKNDIQLQKAIEVLKARGHPRGGLPPLTPTAARPAPSTGARTTGR